MKRQRKGDYAREEVAVKESIRFYRVNCTYKERKKILSYKAPEYIVLENLMATL